MSAIKSMRDAVAAALVDLATSDPAVALVCPDSVKAMRAAAFASRFPERLFEVGIAEQHAVAFAAGLAACGMKPYVGTYAGFLTMRACEQVRTFIAYPGFNVTLIGANGGIAAGEREGVTHQFFEDLGIMRCIPGMTVVAPADADQAGRALRALARVDGPCYMRVGSGRDPVVYEEPREFTLGTARIVSTEGTDVAFFSYGPILLRVIEAARRLAAEGIRSTVVEVHTLKPLDVDTVCSVLERTGAGVTVEDHSIIGGLGSAVAEAAGENCPAALERVGLRDVFAESGEGEALLDAYGMSVAHIMASARRAAERARLHAAAGFTRSTS